MKRTIYLTESDIHNMVLEAVSELANNDYIAEGKLKDAGLCLATLAGIGAGGSALQNMHSDVTYPQSVFYDVEQKKAKEAAQDTLNYSEHMEQEYTNRGKSQLAHILGKPLENKKQDKKPKHQIVRKQKSMYDNYYPSPDILNKIKQFEGWHGGFDNQGNPKPGWQNDGKGYLTTGWGFKITPELKRAYPHGMTREQADAYFKVLIPKMTKEFRQSVPNINKYSQNQLDALFDLFYNIGYFKFTSESPNLQQGLADEDYDTIIKNMDHDYNDDSVPGARKRRDYERTLFLT